MLKANAGSFHEAIREIDRILPREGAQYGGLMSLRVDSGEARLSARNRHVAATVRTPCDGQDGFEANLSRDCVAAVASIANRDQDATIKVGATPRRHSRKVQLPDKTESEVWYDQVEIRSPTASFKFDVFHAPPQIADAPPMAKSYVFDPEPLRDVLSLLGDVRDETNAKFNLCGIHLASADRDGYVRATAADGHRLGVIEVPARGDVAGIRSPVMPYRIIKCVLSLLGDHDGEVEIGFDESLCGVRIGRATYYSPLDTREFPQSFVRIKRMADHGKVIGTVDRLLLKRCLEQARITTNPALDCVSVHIIGSPEGLVFRSSSPDVGSSIITPPIGVGESFKISIDPGYVIPVLRRLHEESITITVDGDVAIQLSTPGFIYILMGTFQV